MTPRGAEVLKAIRHFVTEKGYSPTSAELGAVLHVGRVTAYRHVKRLEAEELVRLAPGRKRSVVPVEPRQDGPLDDLFGRAMVTIAMEIEAALIGRVDVERLRRACQMAKDYARMWIEETLRRAALAEAEAVPGCPDVAPPSPTAAATDPSILV